MQLLDNISYIRNMKPIINFSQDTFGTHAYQMWKYKIMAKKKDIIPIDVILMFCLTM